MRVSLFVSRAPNSSSSIGEGDQTPPPSGRPRPPHTLVASSSSSAHEEVEKPSTTEETHKERAGPPQRTLANVDAEKDMLEHAEANSETSRTRHTVSSGRPDTATLVMDAVRATPAEQRVLVAVCGPRALMKTVRNTTAKCIRGDGPGVELHCEQFGW